MNILPRLSKIPSLLLPYRGLENNTRAKPTPVCYYFPCYIINGVFVHVSYTIWFYYGRNIDNIRFALFNLHRCCRFIVCRVVNAARRSYGHIVVHICSLKA